MDNIQYKAPRWAIDLVKKIHNSHDNFECRTMALDLLSDCCDYEVANGLVYDSRGQGIEESDTFEAVTVNPTPTHAVYNSPYPHYSLESGRLYPITDWTGSSFYVVKPDGSVMFCLTENCAHIEPAQWTLVHVD